MLWYNLVKCSLDSEANKEYEHKEKVLLGIGCQKTQRKEETEREWGTQKEMQFLVGGAG